MLSPNANSLRSARLRLPSARIRGLGVVEVPTLKISDLELGAGIIGSGLLIGGLTIEGTAGMLMAIAGGVALAGAALSVLPRGLQVMAQNAAAPTGYATPTGLPPAPPPLPPPPPTAIKPTRAQQVASYASIAMPFVEGLLKIV